MVEFKAINLIWRRDSQIQERLWHIQALFMTTRLEKPLPAMFADRDLAGRGDARLEKTD